VGPALRQCGNKQTTVSQKIGVCPVVHCLSASPLSLVGIGLRVQPRGGSSSSGRPHWENELTGDILVDIEIGVARTACLRSPNAQRSKHASAPRRSHRRG
jgi:hypothetical protein